MDSIRVLIADDHAVLRAGVRLLIDAEQDMTVVGEAGDGHEVLRLASQLAAEVILLDLSMPDLGGLEVIAQLRQVCPQTRILVLTMHDDPAYFRVALAAGAHGYVLKRAASAELLSGIRAVARGRTFVDLATTTTAMRDMVAGLRAGGDAGAGAQPRQLLSPREQAVLRLLAAGYTNQEAATRLHVSVKTVETYRARLYRKLGVSTRAELVRYAVSAGILTAEQVERDQESG